jgi:hypothetical protein
MSRVEEKRPEVEEDSDGDEPRVVPQAEVVAVERAFTLVHPEHLDVVEQYYVQLGPPGDKS